MNVCLKMGIAIADENCILEITSENSSENCMSASLAVFSVSKPVQKWYSTYFRRRGDAECGRL